MMTELMKYPFNHSAFNMLFNFMNLIKLVIKIIHYLCGLCVQIVFRLVIDQCISQPAHSKIVFVSNPTLVCIHK